MDNNTTKNPIPLEEEIQQQLKTRFELLPKDLQQAILDDNYPSKLLEIAKKHKLTYEELGILETETTLVLMGMTKAEDYRDQLQIQLKKNDPEIDSIVADVNLEVFTPIRSSLMKLSEGHEKQEVVGEEYEPETLPGKEEEVLRKTGIEVEKTPTIQEAPMVEQNPDRGVILKGIENPSRTIIADKLTSTQKSTATVTDHSITKEKRDPYREPIE